MTFTESPITRRVAVLSNRWLKFATDERARLLCWQLADDETRMLEAFFAMETDDRTTRHPDLFISLESAFELAPGRTVLLQQELVDQFERERAALRAEGVRADWEPLPVPDGEADVSFFARSCRSFLEQYLGQALLRLTEVTDRGAQRNELEQVIASLAGGTPSDASAGAALGPT